MSSEVKLGVTGTYNPQAEPVFLQIGTFHASIPATLLVAEGRSFVFSGRAGGAHLNLKIYPKGTGTFRITAEARGVDLSRLTNPVSISINLGNKHRNQ
jgi:hypothetical protein